MQYFIYFHLLSNASSDHLTYHKRVNNKTVTHEDHWYACPILTVIVINGISLCKNCPYWEFFWSVLSRIRTEYGRKNPNKETFYAVFCF